MFWTAKGVCKLSSICFDTTNEKSCVLRNYFIYNVCIMTVQTEVVINNILTAYKNSEFCCLTLGVLLKF